MRQGNETQHCVARENKGYAVMKDFQVTIRVKNNHLVQRRTELGMTCGQVAAEAGVQPGTYSGLETMRISPLAKKGSETWTRTALKIAAYHGISPDELWPDAVLSVRTTTATRLMQGEELQRLSATAPDKNLTIESGVNHVRALAAKELSPMEWKILQLRFQDGMTGRAVGRLYNLSVTRILQLEEQALRKLREADKKANLRAASALRGLPSVAKAAS